MALAKFVTFAVLKILDPFPKQNTADVSEFLKTAQRDLTFILKVPSESSIHFA